jgi:hypothetical protein
MRVIGLLTILISVVFLTGCVDYEETITLNADGSGTITVHFSYSEDLVVEKLGEEEFFFSLDKEEIESELGAQNVRVDKIDKYMEEELHHSIVTLSFVDINLIPDKWAFEDRGFGFRDEGGTLLFYSLLARGKDQAVVVEDDDGATHPEKELTGFAGEMLFSDYTFKTTVTLPGKVIEASEGGVIENNTVSWVYPLNSMINNDVDVEVSARVEKPTSHSVWKWAVIGLAVIAGILTVSLL